MCCQETCWKQRQKQGGAFISVLFALPAIASAKAEGSILCRWFRKRTSRLLSATTAYNARNATSVRRETTIDRSLVRLPTQSRRLLLADWLAY